MPLRRIVLRLARNPGYPDGDDQQGYVLVAPLDAGGKIDDDEVVVDDGTGKATGRGGAVGAWRDAFTGVNAGATLG